LPLTPGIIIANASLGLRVKNLLHAWVLFDPMVHEQQSRSFLSRFKLHEVMHGFAISLQRCRDLPAVFQHCCHIVIAFTCLPPGKSMPSPKLYTNIAAQRPLHTTQRLITISIDEVDVLIQAAIIGS
jgi:hypothetical protein